MKRLAVFTSLKNRKANKRNTKEKYRLKSLTGETVSITKKTFQCIWTCGSINIRSKISINVNGMM